MIYVAYKITDDDMRIIDAIKASSVSFDEHGSLVLYDRSGNIVAGYAKGTWVAFSDKPMIQGPKASK